VDAAVAAASAVGAAAAADVFVWRRGGVGGGWGRATPVRAANEGGRDAWVGVEGNREGREGEGEEERARAGTGRLFE